VTVYALFTAAAVAARVRLHARLWPGFAGCERPAEPALTRRDPFRRAHRSSDDGCARDPVGHGCLRPHVEKGGKDRDQRNQRRHHCQLIILAREVRARASHGSVAPLPSKLSP